MRDAYYAKAQSIIVKHDLLNLNWHCCGLSEFPLIEETKRFEVDENVVVRDVKSKWGIITNC